MGTTKVWKIRRTKDGKFSMGGSRPYFGKVGKIWKERHHLTRHLDQISNIKDYEGCMIVEYTTTETAVEPIGEALVEIAQNRTQREQEQQERWARAEEARARAQFERLKQRFG